MKLDSLVLVEREQLPQYKKELTEHRFVDLLNSHCKNSHNVAKRIPLYVRMTGADFIQIDPLQREERSPFWIDRLIKEMTAWKMFPSRSRCLKVFTDKDGIGDGDLYVVFPYDKARIGVCSGSTFYKSFTHLKKAVDVSRVDNTALHNWIKKLISALNKVESKIRINVEDDHGTFSEFKKLLDKVTKEVTEHGFQKLHKALVKSDSPTDEEMKIAKNFLDRHLSADRYLEVMLDPGTNDFVTMRIESLQKPYSGREMWVSAPCLLIKRDKYVEMHERGDIK